MRIKQLQDTLTKVEEGLGQEPWQFGKPGIFSKKKSAKIQYE